HSIFYETQLEYLLRQEDVGKILLTGQVTEQCILYSALDAYVRHFEVSVAVDAVAHIHEDLAQAALRMMELNMQAELVSGTRLSRYPRRPRSRGRGPESRASYRRCRQADHGGFGPGRLGDKQRATQFPATGGQEH